MVEYKQHDLQSKMVESRQKDLSNTYSKFKRKDRAIRRLKDDQFLKNKTVFPMPTSENRCHQRALSVHTTKMTRNSKTTSKYSLGVIGKP